MHKFAADLELEGRSLQPRAVPTSNEAGVGGSCCFVVKTTEVGVTEIDWLREALGHCQRSGGLVESRDFTRPQLISELYRFQLSVFVGSQLLLWVRFKREIPSAPTLESLGARLCRLQA